jgi:hypothetical protein
MERYIEKSGETIKDAIIILDVENHFEGVVEEYEYLERKFRKRGKNWELEMQALIKTGNKNYDKMVLRFPDGSRKTIYFDITSFFGKWGGDV